MFFLDQNNRLLVLKAFINSVSMVTPLWNCLLSCDRWIPLFFFWKESVLANQNAKWGGMMFQTNLSPPLLLSIHPTSSHPHQCLSSNCHHSLYSCLNILVGFSCRWVSPVSLLLVLINGTYTESEGLWYENFTELIICFQFYSDSSDNNDSNLAWILIRSDQSV